MKNEGLLVAVIDDDDATCRGVARLLGAMGYRVRAYTTANEFLEEADAATPSCVLADILMPQVDGLALVRAMHNAGNDIPAIFMTATGHVPTVVEAMKAGAVDLLAKPFTEAALREAIERAVESSRRLRADHRDTIEVWRQVRRLTPREAEVCALVASGMPNKRVAARLGTKEKTIKVHRGRVMQKLQLGTLPELVRLVDCLAGQRVQSIKLDGMEFVRPRSAEIILDLIARERAAQSPLVPEAVDQQTMPHTW